MEADPRAPETKTGSLHQQVFGHLIGTAEFLAKRPFRARAINQDTAANARIRRCVSQFAKLCSRIEGKKPDTRIVSKSDVGPTFDRIAE